MDVSDTLPIIFACFAIFEGLQVYMMLRAVKAIQRRMDAVLPEDTKAGDIMAQGVISLMARIQTNPEDAKVVGGFIRGAAITAWEEVSAMIPGVGPVINANDAMQRARKKNPWIDAGMAVVELAVPVIQAVQQQGAQPGQPPRKGTGGRQYG